VKRYGEATVRVREGRVYYVWESPMDSEPTIQRYWYATAARPEQVKDGGQARKEAPGCVLLERSEGGKSIAQSTWLQAAMDGSTPTFTETEQIPPPRVRKGVEIRYYSGAWERYYKGQGWIPVSLA
jgi:hypothetical protein